MNPKIGDYLLSDRLGEVEIIRIRDFGTVDVRCRATDKYYRISGLMGAEWRAVGQYHPEPGSNREPVIFRAGLADHYEGAP